MIMKIFCILLVTAGILVGCAGNQPGIVRINPRYYGNFQILSRTVKPDEETYLFQSTTGIFSFDLEPFDAALKKLTFILKDQGKLASLSVYQTGDQWIELYTATRGGIPGIDVQKENGTFIVTCTDPALNYLRRGGRFQVINEYRE
jgi:hypothetical protein